MSKTMSTFERQVDEAGRWFASPRFAGIVRLYSPREVAEQREGAGRAATRQRPRLHGGEVLGLVHDQVAVGDDVAVQEGRGLVEAEDLRVRGPR